jgi:hypothetical protein
MSILAVMHKFQPESRLRNSLALKKQLAELTGSD